MYLQSTVGLSRTLFCNRQVSGVLDMLRCKKTTKISPGTPKSRTKVLYYRGAIWDVPLEHTRNLPESHVDPTIFRNIQMVCFFFLPWLLYWGHVTIIHWPSHPRMNCSDSTSPNPSSKSWIFILFLLPRIQLQHLAVAMLLASCKKRSLQHVGCLPKKSHRNLADVCSLKKQNTGTSCSGALRRKTSKTSRLLWC